MSISPINTSAQTGLVPQTLLGYSSNGVSALEITPTTITLGGNLTTTPVYVSINATSGLTTTNPNGLDINCDLDMNSNDITNLNSITATSAFSINATTIDIITSTGDIVLETPTQVAILDTAGLNTNIITSSGYTTKNSVQNITHYLNFSDNSATGVGPIQKTTGISCNPSTNTITATTFNGNASNATQVSLTSDNTSGTYYIPFSKTTTANNNTLFIDNATGPLTYNAVNSTLNCQTVDASIILPTSTTNATFAGTTLTCNFGTTSLAGFRVGMIGSTNTISILAFTNGVINGRYTITIANTGSGDLTINGTFAPSATYLTTDNTVLTIPTGGQALMVVRLLTFTVGGNDYIIERYRLY